MAAGGPARPEASGRVDQASRPRSSGAEAEDRAGRPRSSGAEAEDRAAEAIAWHVSRAWRRIATRVAVAAIVAATAALAILVTGVWLVGGKAFTDLMVEAGDSADHARQMFDRSVTDVLVVAVLIAVVAAVILAALLARWLARPLELVGAAARRIADGDYGARVPRDGPDEIVGLADTFNQMATSLEEQERLRRDFIINAAHELRTPLTNLQGHLEALRDGVITADRATYDSLWEEADRLVRLARSLDALGQGDPSTRPAMLIELDVAGVLQSAVELVRPAFDARDVTIERRWPEPLPGRCDPDHLAQILANLLQNAERYTPPGGHVTVTAEPRAGEILVSITNTGVVIPEADLPHVFERFYRVEKSRDRGRGGAGIGLAIVKQLVEAGGGHVGARSSGGTTRFWFTLPTKGGEPA